MGIGDCGLGIGDWAQSPSPFHFQSFLDCLFPFIFNLNNIFYIILFSVWELKENTIVILYPIFNYKQKNHLNKVILFLFIIVIITIIFLFLSIYIILTLFNFFFSIIHLLHISLLYSFYWP